MRERFDRIFSLASNLYTEGAPLIISAGALLKDTETGRILAQLKFKNVSPKRIKAVKVRITPLDTIEKPIGDKVLFDYLDLDEKRDAEFGQKKAIPMPNSTTRSFIVEVIEVVFINNTVWSATDSAWNPLDALVPLEQALGEHELVKQYRMRFGATAKYKPQRDTGLWRCSCGSVNNAQEDKCHSCGCAASALFTCNYEELKTESTVRIEQEREAEKKETKKRKKIAVIIFSCAFICVVAFVLITKVFIPNRNYNQAVALIEEGQYEAAITAFKALGDYKDSSKQLDAAEQARIEEIKEKEYEQAEQLFAAGDLNEAKILYEDLGLYKDAAKRIVEIDNKEKYSDAERAVSDGDYYSAYQYLISIHGNYKDSSEKISQIKEQHPYVCAVVGSTINFGSYEQDNNLQNGKEPIEWIVIEISENTMVLYSRYCLDAQRFSAELRGQDVKPYYSSVKNSWEETSLYKWLNDSFLSSAFNFKERQALAEPVTLISASQAYDLPNVAKPLLVTKYVETIEDSKDEYVWIEGDASYIGDGPSIGAGALAYWHGSNSFSVFERNCLLASDIAYVRPLIVVDVNIAA